MATLTGKQLKDSYQGLLTIKTADDANPLSGRLENGKGNAITNLGIGIDSDLVYPLTIKEDTNNSYIHFVNSTTGSLFSDGTQIGVPSGQSDFLINNRESANIRLFTSGSEAMRIQSSGAVGIDNSSPDSFSASVSTSSSLVIGQGASGVSPGLTLWQGNSAQATINFATANTGASQYEGRIRYTRDTGVMDFRTNNVDNVLVLNASGNVGIGTTPSTPLNVAGSAGGGSIKISGDMSAGAYYYGYMFDASSLQGTTQTNIFYAGGAVKADTTITDFASLRIDAPSTSASNAVITNNYGIYQSSTAQKNFFGGNVGIGTDNAEKRLHINDNTQANQAIRFGNPTATPYGEINYDASGAEHLYIRAKGTTTGYGNIVFESGGSLNEAMRIDSSGNVGIGVSPSATLHIDNPANPTSLRIGSNTTDDCFILFNTDGNDWAMGADRSASNSFKISDNSSLGTADRLVIDTSGRIGVGVSPESWTTWTPIQIGQASTFAGRISANQTDVANNWYYDGTEKRINAGYAQRYVQDVNGDHYWMTAGTSTADSTISFSTPMIIKNNGNVGIGNTDPDHPLTVTAGPSSAGVPVAWIHNSTNSADHDGTVISSTNDGADAEVLHVRANNTTYNNGTSLMLVRGDGNVLVGTTSTDVYLNNTANDGGISMMKSAQGFRLDVARDGNCYTANRPSTTGNVFDFRQAGVNVGAISITSSATAYNTSSDYRLKENVVAMTGALDRVDQLNPSRFNFIADANTTVDGFLAHEVADVVPEAISGEKDAVDEEGNPIYQGIDQSKLVPLLVGAIKELRAEIEQLKNQ